MTKYEDGYKFGYAQAIQDVLEGKYKEQFLKYRTIKNVNKNVKKMKKE